MRYGLGEDDEEPEKTADVSLPKFGQCFWLVVPLGKFASTNQKHYPDLGSDTSSVWNFCSRSSGVIKELKQLRRRQLQKTLDLMIKTAALHMHHAF